ncbi:MAG: hypothetical protein VX777_00830 [Chlamydiota bacterium]|nr:hypothetical protein [Chlamydiota bacterium]
MLKIFLSFLGIILLILVKERMNKRKDAEQFLITLDRRIYDLLQDIKGLYSLPQKKQIVKNKRGEPVDETTIHRSFLEIVEFIELNNSIAHKEIEKYIKELKDSESKWMNLVSVYNGNTDQYFSTDEVPEKLQKERENFINKLENLRVEIKKQL